MITHAEFCTIKGGDILLFRSRKQFTLRTVMQGPADDGDTNHIVLPIRRRSWTGRIHTYKCWNDVKHQIVCILPRDGACLISLEETERLRASGFKKRDFFREMRKHGVTDTRFGRDERFVDRLEETWHRCVKRGLEA